MQTLHARQKNQNSFNQAKELPGNSYETHWVRLRCGQAGWSCIHLGALEGLVQLLVQHRAEVLGQRLRVLHGEGAEGGREGMCSRGGAKGRGQAGEAVQRQQQLDPPLLDEQPAGLRICAHVVQHTRGVADALW